MVNMLQPFLPIFLFSFLLVYHSLSANADCGGELNAEYGRLGATAYDAYYSNGRKCEWKITATQGRKVTLIFHTMNLGNSYSCYYGKIKVYYSEWSDPLTYCGIQIPRRIISSNNRMRIVFQSNYTSRDRKFIATYISTITGCGGYLNELTGSFVSPGFPNKYPVKSDCWWNITVEEGRRITLFFTQFDVEYLNTCAYDNVTVYDSISGKSKLIYTHCGNTNPAPINSSENKLEVCFKSDHVRNYKGFHAVYFTRVVYCGQPPFPAHGHLISDFTENYVYGGVIQITCDEGYKVRSGNPIQCQYNGQWSGAEPFCEGQVVTTENALKSVQAETGQVVATENSLKSVQAQTVLGIILGLALLIIAGLVIYIVLDRHKKSEDAIEMHDRNTSRATDGTTMTNMSNVAHLSIATNHFTNPDEMEIEDNLYYGSLEASGGSQHQPSSTTAAAGQRGPVTGDIYAEVDKKQENLYTNM